MPCQHHYTACSLQCQYVEWNWKTECEKKEQYKNTNFNQSEVLFIDRDPLLFLHIGPLFGMENDDVSIKTEAAV